LFATRELEKKYENDIEDQLYNHKEKSEKCDQIFRTLPKSYRIQPILRAIIIPSVCGLFTLAIFKEIFVVDPFLGIYGVGVVFLIFASFFFRYTKYKDPSLISSSVDSHGDVSVPELRKPLASVIIAAKNEPFLISNAVNACLKSSYDNLEIFLVNDGSTDDTGVRMDLLHEENPDKVKVFHTAKNMGKRKAIVQAITHGDIKGEIIVLHDSDTIVHENAIERLINAFKDPNVGAATAYCRAMNADENFLTKMQDVWYHGSFSIFKGMESSFGSVTCCSGVLSAYRREAIMPCLDSWSNDKFLGEEFIPGDDRQLTSYVIGGNKHYLGKQYRTWKACYCESAQILTEVPSTFRKFVNQQIRWKKSWVRVFLFNAPFYYRDRDPIAAAFYYIQTILSFVGPIIILRNLIILPMIGHYLPAVLYVAGIMFIASLFAMDFKFRNPNSGNRWVYRFILTLISVIGLNTLLYYSIYTIKRRSWLTR
jgi:cellulose synthase/poly-beta-1,6-N-acetylglucosamine synthase-like glycosyltransferase